MTGPQSSVEVDLSLSLVCDEEEISTDTTTRHCVSASSARKLDSEDRIRRESVGLTGRTAIRKVKPVHLSRFELEGLTAVAEWLKSLPAGKRNVPKDLPAPDVLLDDVEVSTTSLDSINTDRSMWITVGNCCHQRQPE